MKNRNWKYYGVFFNDNTKTHLYKTAKYYLDLPFYFEKREFVDIDTWKKYCDHVTIVYNDGNVEKQKLAETLEPLIGTKETMQVTHIGLSDMAVAFRVDYKTTNKISHVTVAVAPNAKPVESNYITDWEEIEPFYISGKLDKR